MERKEKKRVFKQRRGLDESVLVEGKAWLKFKKNAFESGRFNLIHMNS